MDESGERANARPAAKAERVLVGILLRGRPLSRRV